MTICPIWRRRWYDHGHCKSGTNQFHGSAFELRNNVLDARNFFATSVPPFQRNEFGVTFGGPIKKNKTFFFLQYAGLRQRFGEPTVIPVPTPAERNGAVTITRASGQPNDLQVPLNPVAQSVLNKAWYPSDRLRNGYTITDNLTVEELPGSVDLQLSYVGNNAVHLYNEGFPNAYTGAESQYAPYTPYSSFWVKTHVLTKPSSTGTTWTDSRLGGEG
jgi:hypothetical protein